MAEQTTPDHWSPMILIMESVVLLQIEGVQLTLRMVPTNSKVIMKEV